MGKPRVTWLLPVRNDAADLDPTLRSIAEQSYTKQSVLAWDDGSTDGSLALLRKWIGPRLAGRVIASESVGRSKALAMLVLAAQTELIARIDPGCVAEPGRIQAQAAHLVAHRRVGLVGSAMGVIDQPQRVIDQPADDPSLRWALRFTNPVNHPSVMLRRSAVLEVGNYRPLGSVSEDYDLWARLGLIVRFATLPEVLTHCRADHLAPIGGDGPASARMFYHQRNALIGRLLPGIPPSDAARLLDLVRRPDDLSVTGADLSGFRLAAQLAARACRYKPDYFTQTALFKRQYNNLITRRLKGQPLIRPVWPLLKGAGRLMLRNDNPPPGATPAAT